jgi:prevent-host-death family protein
MTKWQLQEAKKRLFEVVRKASDEGPQVITLGSDDAVVVVAAADCARLTPKPKGTLIDFFRKSPFGAVVLDYTRSHDSGRRHALTVVTRNTGDLERCGARCFNPWVGS